MTRHHTISIALAVLAAAACTKARTTPEEPVEISLRSAGEQTRSAVESPTFPAGYDMLVSAYRNAGSNPADAAPGDYFEGVRFTRDASTGTWKSAQGAKYYPAEGTLDLLAVASAGYKSASTGIAPAVTWGAGSGSSHNTARQAVLTVPDNSARFDDLMYAAANAQALSGSGTSLSFRHAMASLVFVARCNVPYSSVSNSGITIDGITVDNARYGGTLTVGNPAAGGGSGSLTAAWSALSAQQAHVSARVWNSANLGNNTSEPALTGLHLTGSYTDLTQHPFGEAYVILPPQAASPITVNYTMHNGFENDGTTPINKQYTYQIDPIDNWEAGKRNVYEIDFTMYEILISVTMLEWGTNSISGVGFPVGD